MALGTWPHCPCHGYPRYGNFGGSVVTDRQTTTRHYCDNSWSLVHYCVRVRSAKSKLFTARTSHKPCRLWPNWNLDLQAGSGCQFLKNVPKLHGLRKMPFSIHDVHRPLYNSGHMVCLTVKHHLCTCSHYAVEMQFVKSCIHIIKWVIYYCAMLTDYPICCCLIFNIEESNGKTASRFKSTWNKIDWGQQNR